MKIKNRYTLLFPEFGGVGVMLLLLLFSSLLKAQDKKYTPKEYLEMYKPLAIAEMRRTGIPASITLAQGLLESGTGNSKLAREANNHFGIKCKKDWTGKSMNLDDDAPQECFRVYDKPEESYYDHSEFIVNNKRYASLFQLDPKDYKAWASGLKQAGYATNPHYPDLLIASIETYKLNELDESIHVKPDTSAIDSQHFEFNGAPAYIFKAGDNLEAIAKAHDVSVSQIRKYNDLCETDVPEVGTVLYLKSKNRNGTQDKYVMKDGEGMYYVSQLFRIKLKQLYRKNKLECGEQPKPGEIIYLKTKRDSAPQTLAKGTNSSVPKHGVVLKHTVTVPEPKIEAEGKILDSITKQETLGFKKPVLPVIDSTLPVRMDSTIHRVDTRIKERNAARRTNFDSLAKIEFAKTHKANEDSFRNEGNNVLNQSHSGTNAHPLKDSIVRVKSPEDTMRNHGSNVLNQSHSGRDTTALRKIIKPELRKDTIPVIKDEEGFHIVQKGETLYSISKKYKVNLDSLKAWNTIGNNDVKSGRKLSLKPLIKKQADSSVQDIDYHVVQKGESLFSIAKKYNLSLDKIKQLNGLTDANIKAGDKLKVR